VFCGGEGIQLDEVSRVAVRVLQEKKEGAAAGFRLSSCCKNWKKKRDKLLRRIEA
jgi:hypothetical protein